MFLYILEGKKGLVLEIKSVTVYTGPEKTENSPFAKDKLFLKKNILPTAPCICKYCRAKSHADIRSIFRVELTC